MWPQSTIPKRQRIVENLYFSTGVNSFLLELIQHHYHSVHWCYQHLDTMSWFVEYGHFQCIVDLMLMMMVYIMALCRTFYYLVRRLNWFMLNVYVIGRVMWLEYFSYFFLYVTQSCYCTTYISVKKFKLFFNFLLFLLSLIVHVFDIVSLQINIFKFMNFHIFAVFFICEFKFSEKI